MGVEDDLGDSAESFEKVVSPIVEDWIGGELKSTEGFMDDEIATRLDQDSGIDVFKFAGEGGGTVGVASRVQFGDAALDMYNSPWNTFTVRYERSSGVDTEYQKRKREMYSPAPISPYYTVQAYLTEPCGDLISVSMVETERLIRFCEDNLEGTDVGYKGGGYGNRQAQDEDIPDRWARFYWVKWWYLIERTTVGPRTWPVGEPYDEGVLNQYINSSFDDFSSDAAGVGGGD